MSLGGGGGSEKSTTNAQPVYTGAQQSAQQDVYNQTYEGLKPGWSSPGGPATGIGAYSMYAPNQWMQQTGQNTYNQLANQFNGPAAGMDQWMQTVNQGIAANPAINPAYLQAMTPAAYNLSNYMSPYTGQATGYGGPGQGGQYTMTPQGVMAYDPNAALSSATNYMNQILAPQIANNMVAGGQGASSGAMLEAQANAAAQMAMPINQQVMANQAAWYNPQMQATLQGGLAQQGSQNQMLYGTQQAAQNAALQTQQAQNQFYGAQQQAGLQGLLNTGQNLYNYNMNIPAAQGQMISNMANAGQAQMGIASMDQQAQLNAYLNQQQQYNMMLNQMNALGSGSPAVSSTTTQSGGGGGSTGANVMGNAAMGAMIGTQIMPGWGTAIGAVGGGLMGLF